MRRRLATPAALAVLMLGLTACVGDDGTGPITEAPSYPNQGSDDGGESPEESDGGGDDEGDEQAAPDIPAPDPADYPGMDENTPEGAEQFTRYYFDVAFWSHQTGDSSVLEGIIAEECGGCADSVEDVRRMSERGLLWSEFSVEVEEVQAQESDGYDLIVTYRAVVGAHSEHDIETWKAVEVGEQRYLAAAGVVWDGGKWKMGGLTAEATDV